MSDPIRTALERLLSDIQDLSDYSEGIVGLHRNGDPAPWNELLEGGRYSSWLGDAIAAARAALAEQQGKGPSDEELCDLWSWAAAQDHGPWPTQQHCFARAVLARWGHRPGPHDDRGVLPMIISDTGASDEPERERIICASISGGADYINNMPRMLILERITSEGSTYQQYIQEPTPPAEGEVAELAAKLRRLAPHNPLGTADPTITRAAELLQQQQPTPVPVSVEREGAND